MDVNNWVCATHESLIPQASCVFWLVFLNLTYTDTPQPLKGIRLPEFAGGRTAEPLAGLFITFLLSDNTQRTLSFSHLQTHQVSRITENRWAVVTEHKGRMESDPWTGYCRERGGGGTGSTNEGADGGVTLRERRGGRKGTQWKNLFISFSGHEPVDSERAQWWALARIHAGYMSSGVKIQ